MKQFLRLGSFLLLFLSGCDSRDQQSTTNSGSEDDLDAGRNFVRATLDGDYSRARTLMLQDSTNLDWINIYERSYRERMTDEHKKAYKEASINIHEFKKLNDSTSQLRYSNSYFKKDTHQLRIIKNNNQWLVDFKSYLDEMKDNIRTGPMTTKKDSLP